MLGCCSWAVSVWMGASLWYFDEEECATFNVLRCVIVFMMCVTNQTYVGETQLYTFHLSQKDGYLATTMNCPELSRSKETRSHGTTKEKSTSPDQISDFIWRFASCVMTISPATPLALTECVRTTLSVNEVLVAIDVCDSSRKQTVKYLQGVVICFSPVGISSAACSWQCALSLSGCCRHPCPAWAAAIFAD